MNELDLVRMLFAIKSGGLPNPRPTRADLEKIAKDGYIEARSWGWSLTRKGYDLTNGYVMDVVKKDDGVL